METLASKLLTVLDGQLQRNFRAIADHVDRVIGSGGDGIPETIVDAKGDIIAASADDTPVRVAVGADDHILVADSSAGAGVAWKSPAADGAPLGNRVFQAKDYASLLAMFIAGGSDAVYILEPDHQYDESIVITLDRIVVLGGGWSTIINGGITGHAFQSGGDHCLFSNFSVSTTAGAGNNYFGVRLVSCSHVTLDHIRVINSDFQGIRFGAVSHGSIQNCLVEDADDDGIYADSVCSHISIINNTILTCSGNYGLRMNADVGNVIGNRILVGPTSAQLRLDTGSTYISCIGNGTAYHSVSNAGVNNSVGHNT